MKTILLSATTLLMLSSCVTKKEFTELSNKYDRLSRSNSDLSAKNKSLQKSKSEFSNDIQNLKKEREICKNDVDKMKEELASLNNRYKNLQESYKDLSANSSSTINAKIKENQKLLAEVEAKENKLTEEEVKLSKLKAALDARSKRIEDLESLIASKEAAMQKLKNAISKALIGFEGKGLTVENRDGKIYVSMENKLLFQPGKWAVGSNGKSAVIELAKVLEQNPEINVLIEGHTDNDPYKSGGVIQDNWDLSVKRATAIVRILESQKVSPKQITAAGHGEYIPVASNETSAGKAKNRRIEIVLSPNLDEVTKLLNE